MHLIRVLIADDHPLFREGLRAILSVEPDLTVVGEAADGHAAQSLAKQLYPDVLLLDLNMPGPAVAETVTAVYAYSPGTAVLVLTAYDDVTYIQQALTAGVSGYVLKGETPKVLMQAIHMVQEGGKWFSQPILEKLVHWQKNRVAPHSVISFTEREREILALIAQGWNNDCIAVKANLAEQTVRNYVSRIYTKLGVCSRAEAIVKAREQGLGGP